MSALQFALLGIQLLTAVVIAVIGYFSRKYITEIDKNTRMRRQLWGDSYFDTDGHLDEITAMHDDYSDDIDDIKESLEHTQEQLDIVISVLEQHTEVEIDDPDADFKITDD